MKLLNILTASLALSIAILSAETEVYKIDTTHSGVRFEIPHFFTKVPGSFGNFQGEIHYNTSDPTQSKATATIIVSSIDTNNDDRDAHLRNEDFFTEAQFPEITYTSTAWEQTGPNTFKVAGELTMLGVTNNVELEVELLGFGQGRGGTKISGWEAKGELDRRDWGMRGFNPPVGNNVDIMINVQGHLQNP